MKILKNRTVVFTVVVALAVAAAYLTLIGPSWSPSVLPVNPDYTDRPDRLDYFTAQGESPSEGKLSKGKFLVAGRHLLDSRFQQTVILLLHYGQSGAMGVIINRPTELSVADAIADNPAFKKTRDPVFFGGPVEGDRMLLLVRSPERPEDSEPILSTVYVSASMVVLTRIVDNPKAGERFRLYAGYAGWAAGQLEMELRRGDWHVVEADARTIFELKPEKVWTEMMRRGSAIQVRTTGGRGEIS